MITASDAVLATVGFFGFGAHGIEADRPAAAVDTASPSEPDHHTSPDLLSAGEPAFEAVAEALRRTGYLDS
jgi:hypothetical protein